MSNSVYNVGIGRIWVTPTNDYLGQPIPANLRKPVLIGAIQEFNYSITSEVKTLKGSESKFPLAQAQTATEITGSFKYGNVTGESIAALMFGQAMDDGAYAAVRDTVVTTIDTTHSKTVAPPNSGTFEKDLGVSYKDTMIQFVRVASAPAVGQYALDDETGTYTFATADETKKVYINYVYTAETGGQSLVVKNSAMGTTPYCRIDVLMNTESGEQTVVTFPKVVISKMDVSGKMDDFAQNSADFKACLDDFGRIFIIGTPR